MAAISETKAAQPRLPSGSLARLATVALLAIAGATAGVVTTATVISFSDRPATLNAPGLAPGSRDDHFRDGRATTVSGSVGDKWYLEQAPASAERVRDTWYRK